MENKSTFVLGLLVLIFAVASIFVPNNNQVIARILMIVSIIINVNAGILLLMSGIWSSKNLGGSGFGIGMAAWCTLLICSIYGIIWNQSELARIDFENIVWTIITWYNYMSYPYGYPIFYPPYLFSFTYIMGFIGSIINLCLAATSTVLGSVAFGLVMREKF